ncbi:hypothetical protein [Streptosporangium sp. H16]|uniref:hypothetical protein n=1 Tax=Streptosporangium sp. H16 TaxID=3444184 RepID=UPI003F7A04F6
MGDRARNRGGTVAAITALQQAARLSEGRQREAARLPRAAELAVESGRTVAVDTGLKYLSGDLFGLGE